MIHDAAPWGQLRRGAQRRHLTDELVTPPGWGPIWLPKCRASAEGIANVLASLHLMFIDAAVALYLINGWASLGATPKALLNFSLMLVCLWLWLGADTGGPTLISLLTR